jgi:long-chain acyl-CoA synthetase
MSAALAAAAVSEIDRFPSLIAMFLARAEQKGDSPFLWTKQDGEWRPTSWREAARQVQALAGSLRRMGLEQGDRVLLVSENRPEWGIAHLGVMAAGCVTVPSYTTNTEADHQHVLNDSGAKAAIVSCQPVARALLPAIHRSHGCAHIIAIEPVRTGQADGVERHDWAELVTAPPPNEALPELGRDDLACLIYTSGTGGAPRGVMLHHGAILHNVAGAAEIFIEDFDAGEEVFLSFLPLSHAYEHTGGLFLPIGMGSQIYYAEGLDKLASNIREVRPTIMMVVPRLFEVFRQRVMNAIEKEGALAQILLRCALALGRKRSKGRLAPWDWPIELLVEKALRPKVRQRFGGRIKAMVSGGAPLNPEVGDFFHALGLTILQGYGQTESAPIVSVNRPKVGLKMATVGVPVRNTEVRIAEDGEILVKGELVMQGYWGNAELSAATVKDGWLYTGDIGHLDELGRLVITDRKKNIIVLDKGDNVAPQRIEGMLTLQPEIAQAMVIGDKRPHLVALLVADAEWTEQWRAEKGKPDDGALCDDPDYRAALAAAVDRVNDRLSVIEKVRRFAIADEPFTVENQQLTPSVKIRRHVINEKYGDRLDALYRK